MDDIIDLIATDSSASSVTDRIKDTLFAKAAERIEASKPIVAGAVFGNEEPTEQEQEE
tara:strand:+ start:489 stop:662 length:174 start_codon:yes stop_codon:yes gene_type:complete